LVYKPVVNFEYGERERESESERGRKREIYNEIVLHWSERNQT